jgi:capsular polysaccharide biosynthesis protein
MDTNDSSKFNSKDAYAPPKSPPREADPFFSHDRSRANASGIRSRGVLSRVARRWWQLLLLWLIITCPIIFVINRLVQPSYEASSLVKIEPVDPQLFGPLRRGENQSSIYLKTEVAVFTTDKVLEPVVANALVGNLPIIKMSQDPKREVREKMKVEILEDTNLIRIALELPNRDDAVTIVQAVVQSYFQQNSDMSRSANRNLTVSLDEQVKKLAEQIVLKREALRGLYKKGKVAMLEPQDMLSGGSEPHPTHPVLSKVTEDQYAKFIDRLAQCDFDCLEATSRLDAAKSIRARDQNKIDEERKRSADGDQGNLSDAKIRELEFAVETATRTRAAFAKQLEQMQVVEKPRKDDTFEAVYLNYQLNSLLNREDQVKKHLEQLAFEAARDHYRVKFLDKASAPQTPSNDKRLKYMAVAPVYVFFLLLGLFLVQEIMAGRSYATPVTRMSD